MAALKVWTDLENLLNARDLSMVSILLDLWTTISEAALRLAEQRHAGSDLH